MFAVRVDRQSILWYVESTFEKKEEEHGLQIKGPVRHGEEDRFEVNGQEDKEVTVLSFGPETGKGWLRPSLFLSLLPNLTAV
ncbi:MAG: hypothetical protein M0Z79_02330 [Nitrospiraceae bacterium]|nr:hypothetical protein [Nitrospiraceae bacterium]